jgi:hypothetical protein
MAAVAQESVTAANDLRREQQEALERTIADLSDARWPSDVHVDPAVHGMRITAGVEEASDGVIVLFVAARARDFESTRWPAQLFEAHGCVALYPLSLGRDPPCYELQVAALRLLQRQVHARYLHRPVALLAVGPEADAIFPALPNLWLSAPDDAVPLRRDGELETLPEPGHAWSLYTHCGTASLQSDLAGDEDADRLASKSGAWADMWRAVRALLRPMIGEQRSAKRRRIRR